MKENPFPKLDRLDLRLLDILQRRCALSVADVASQLRLSSTTCWRRIQLLEQSGVIKARVALLDRNALGLDVTMFAHVKLVTTGRDAIAKFEEAIRDRAEVLECYTLTGEWDFLLKIVDAEHQGLRGVLLGLSVADSARTIGKFLGGCHGHQRVDCVAARHLATPRARHASKTVAPTVFRLASARCASAASRSAMR